MSEKGSYFKNASYNLAATLAQPKFMTDRRFAIAEFESLNHYQLPDNSEGEEKLYAIQGEVIRNEIFQRKEKRRVKDESLMDFQRITWMGKGGRTSSQRHSGREKNIFGISSESREKERKVEIDLKPVFK